MFSKFEKKRIHEFRILTWCWWSRSCVTLGSSILLDVHNNRLLLGWLLSILIDIND